MQAISSCVGLLPAPDDYLGSSPSMVHHCRMSWASATRSDHVPSARTCNTAKFLQLELAAHPSTLATLKNHGEDPVTSKLHKERKPHRQGNRMIVTAFQWNRDDLGYDSEPERTLLRRRREARRRARQAALEQ
ncbi:hypothetical protein PIB30_045119 [Stylosanthes scabra]|uniref:Uncharacterized protein n=1 Tax=Stylosanthes scabra TaxID=79078 RepID=A0ABU6QFN8_9FABA|nr:hypothetical protein [Stylosanthes scabra]